jgi:ABC-2 type transport system permease protein
VTTVPGSATMGRVGWTWPVLASQCSSECRKIVSTSAWWALLLPAALICWLVGLISAKAGGLTFSAPTTVAFALTSVGSKFAAIFGVVSATAEFRHHTITTSYLTAPGRPQLLVAKAVLAAGVGAGYAVVCSILALLGMLMGGGSFNGEFGEAMGVAAVALLVFALWSLLGVGLGALLANQVSAIIGLLVYLLLVEQLISGFAALSDIGRIQEYLPNGAASAALTSLASQSSFGELFSVNVPWWVSLLIFLCYALVIYAAGMAVSQARDVT